MSEISRRKFLYGAGAGLAGLAATRFAPPAGAGPLVTQRSRRLPNPNLSGIDHIVVLCMENRSFDHFLGWVPKANGRQAGLTYLDDEGAPHETHHLTDWQGCGFNDPDHGYGGGRTQVNGGKRGGLSRGGKQHIPARYNTP